MTTTRPHGTKQSLLVPLENTCPSVWDFFHDKKSKYKNKIKASFFLTLHLKLKLGSLEK